MEKLFEGKYAVVTGGTTGIGKETVRVMARNGLAGAIICGRNAELGAETAKELQAEAPECKIYNFATDVGKVDDVKALFKYASEKFPTIHILVNSAGICPYTPWQNVDEKEWDAVLDTDLKSVHFCTQEALKIMVPQKYGKVVSVSSNAARNGTIRASIAYAAAKCGVLGLTKSYAKLVGPDGINVNAVLPGPVATRLTAAFDYTNIITKWPIQRIGEVSDVANAIAYLASDAASWITGVALDVNGGDPCC